MTDQDRLDGARQDLLANGFAIVRSVIGEDDVAAIKRRLAYVAAHAAFYEECGVSFTPPADAVHGESKPLQGFQQVGNLPFLDAECRRHLLAHAGFGRVAMAVLGPDSNVIHAGFFVKPAHHGAAVPWHQDTATWGVPPGAWSPDDAPLIFDYWLALDPTDDANGCLEILPDSHLRGVLPHQPRGRLLAEADPAELGFDPARRVAIAAAPGDLVVYHPDMFHRSAANRSARPRLAAAGTLVAPRDISRMRALLPRLGTLEKCPVYRNGRVVTPAHTLPRRATSLGLLRRRFIRKVRSRLRRIVPS